MVDALSFQAERGSLLSLWALTRRGRRAGRRAGRGRDAGSSPARVRCRRDRALAGDPRRIAALAAAVLIGLQLAANYWTYAYLPWVFPLIALALLTSRRPASWLKPFRLRAPATVAGARGRRSR